MNDYRIKFGDVKISDKTRKDMDDLLRSHRVTEGAKVRKFEEEWGRLFGYKYSIATPSGTVADTLACMALYDFGAQRGDEIIAPALAFAAVGESILAAGFKPSFVDIKRDTLNIDAEKIEEKISDRTRAIMAVHTMGKPAEMDKIMAIANDYDLKVIEDSCEAHGARYQGKYVGNWGDMAAFSFYAAHLIFAGEGGMVSTNDETIAQSIRSVKTHGRRPGTIYFDHQRLGINGKVTDMAAVIGLGQMEEGFWNVYNKRKENLRYLLSKTKDLEGMAFFNLEGPQEDICPHAFSVTLKGDGTAKELFDYLENRGIQTKVNFRSMPTQQQAFAFMGHKEGEFPEAEYVGNKGVHFGIHQHLTREDLDYASEVLHEFFTRK